MINDRKYKVGVVGAGAWGTTLARHLALKDYSIRIWVYEPDIAEEITEQNFNSTYLPGFKLPDTINATNDLTDLADSDRLIIAVPSAFFQETIERLAPSVSKGTHVVSATKGFIDRNLLRPSEYIERILPGCPVGVLSGPNLSREVGSGLPAISLIASENENVISDYQTILSTNRFRVYGGTDVAGTELGGALKNIIAIAAGAADGLNLGQNALAALITRGLAEMIKLGSVLGAQEKTFFGISGLGDLVCTSQSRLSRNHEVGRRLAGGEKLDGILESIAAVPEGATTTKHVHEFGVSHELDLPITKAVYTVLYEDEDPENVLKELMARTLKME